MASPGSPARQQPNRFSDVRETQSASRPHPHEADRVLGDSVPLGPFGDKSPDEILIDQARLNRSVRACPYDEVAAWLARAAGTGRDSRWAPSSSTAAAATAPPGPPPQYQYSEQQQAQVFVGQVPQFVTENVLVMCIEFISQRPGAVVGATLRRSAAHAQAGYALLTLASLEDQRAILHFSRHLFLGHTHLFYAALHQASTFQQVVGRVMALESARVDGAAVPKGATAPQHGVGSRACIVLAPANPPRGRRGAGAAGGLSHAVAPLAAGADPALGEMVSLFPPPPPLPLHTTPVIPFPIGHGSVPPLVPHVAPPPGWFLSPHSTAPIDITASSSAHFAPLSPQTFVAIPVPHGHSFLQQQSVYHSVDTCMAPPGATLSAPLPILSPQFAHAPSQQWAVVVRDVAFSSGAATFGMLALHQPRSNRLSDPTAAAHVTGFPFPTHAQMEPPPPSS
jgi:hypothetical protein